MGDCSSLRELKLPSVVRTGGRGCFVSGWKDLIKWSTILGRGGCDLTLSTLEGKLGELEQNQ